VSHDVCVEVQPNVHQRCMTDVWMRKRPSSSVAWRMCVEVQENVQQHDVLVCVEMQDVQEDVPCGWSRKERYITPPHPKISTRALPFTGFDTTNIGTWDICCENVTPQTLSGRAKVETIWMQK
jgi:hypothetical protein